MRALQKSQYSELTVTKEFERIVNYYLDNYDSTKMEQLKSFLNDLQKGGCVSGMISDFIYNSDCKEFYVEHIDELEQMKEDLEDNIGESIKNRFSVPHYTFMCWLCFEEYCNDLYNALFE